ncbi:helix-turn-helix domain-containing protein [Nocardioides speluncae]|uniref:helix-turn-helix domain-containing protein n=1 Tax=Nocardioides speluncae TaxID=2670337 RepID=UPI000D699534|nr:helix-turn-helix transcriptional regulator [Nocardioides speluncae]
MNFGDGLRTAIASSGLSLDEIARRVAASGHRVSTSTISAWQSGISVPARTASLRALGELERVLGTKAGELVGLVPGSTSRRRTHARSADPAVDASAMWSNRDAVSRLLSRLGAVTEDLAEPEKLFRRLRLTVDAEGNHRHLTIGSLVQAGSEPATRLLYLHQFPWIAELPTIVAPHGLVFNRFKGDHANGLGAFELLFDPPLPARAAAFVEYTVVHPPRLNTTFLEVRTGPTCRELVLSATFDPARRPKRCWAYRKPDAQAEEIRLAELTGNAERTTYQFVRLDPPRGIHGIRWEYDDGR